MRFWGKHRGQGEVMRNTRSARHTVAGECCSARTGLAARAQARRRQRAQGNALSGCYARAGAAGAATQVQRADRQAHRCGVDPAQPGQDVAGLTAAGETAEACSCVKATLRLWWDLWAPAPRSGSRQRAQGGADSPRKHRGAHRSAGRSQRRYRSSAAPGRPSCPYHQRAPATQAEQGSVQSKAPSSCSGRAQ